MTCHALGITRNNLFYVILFFKSGLCDAAIFLPQLIEHLCGGRFLILLGWCINVSFHTTSCFSLL